MESANRVVITGDVLRANANGTPNQPLNIRWLYNLLHYPISRALGSAKLEIVIWDDEGTLDGRRVYELCGLEPNEENWARLATAEELPPGAVEYLSPFFRGAVVIGFELPDVLIRTFHALQIDYVDLTIHPVRFLDDILFGVRTSIPEAFEVLKVRAVDEDVFHIQAGLHKATVSRMTPLPIPADSCLCVGQTRVDKSLVAQGRILSLLDYRDEVQRIIDRHSRTYFKPHPYAAGQEDVVRALVELGDVEITGENIYRLLADEHITEVFGISSSAIYEAAFFGKKGTYLYMNPLRLWDATRPSNFDPWVFVPVYDDLLSPRCWAELLARRLKVNTCPENRLAPKASRLRISLQSHWGYNFLDSELLLRNMTGERV